MLEETEDKNILSCSSYLKTHLAACSSVSPLVDRTVTIETCRSIGAAL